MILHGICARIFSILVLLLGKTFSTQIAFCYFIFQIIGEKSPDLAPSALLFFVTGSVPSAMTFYAKVQ